MCDFLTSLVPKSRSWSKRGSTAAAVVVMLVGICQPVLLAPPGSVTRSLCLGTGCCQKAYGGHSGRASLGSLSERLGMGRAGSRMASPLFGSFRSGGVSISTSVESVKIKPNCMGSHMSAQVTGLAETLSTLMTEILALPHERPQHPSGIQQGIGCTPAVVEGSQFMGAVVFEEAEDVSWHLRCLCNWLLFHISMSFRRQRRGGGGILQSASMRLGSSVVVSCCGAMDDGARPRSVSPALAVGVGKWLMRGAPGSAVLC